MSAFVISEVTILDEDAVNHYRQLASNSIAKFGGKYLVRGATPVIVEGDLTHKNIVVVEFPSMDHINQWYSSPEYAEALKFRDKALNRRLMFAEGISNR
jgi:uncharacterized protein (DUF1330 family)